MEGMFDPIREQKEWEEELKEIEDASRYELRGSGRRPRDDDMTPEAMEFERMGEMYAASLERDDCEPADRLAWEARH